MLPPLLVYLKSILTKLYWSGWCKTLYYLLSRNNKINLIPFIEFTNRRKNIGIYYAPWNYGAGGMAVLNHDFKETSVGLIYPISKFGSISFTYNEFDSRYKFFETGDQIDYENDNISYTKIELDIDQIDNLLHPRIGYNINVTYQKSDDTFYTHQNGDYHNQNGYKYLF